MRCWAFALATTAVFASPAAGQRVADAAVRARPDFYPVSGMVLDSIRKRPLAGAEVVIAGTALHAVTDSVGRFVFDSVAAGEYLIAFFHPFLDSLSVAAAPGVLSIPMESGTAVLLAIPSVATLTRTICQVDSVDAASLLVGRVTDPESGEPVKGASIFVTWTDFEVTKEKAIDRSPQLIQGGTDANGVYRVCGLPAEFEAVVYAARDSSSTSQVPISTQSGGLMIRNLTLENRATSAGRRASITGRVVSARGGPIAGASIAVPGSARTALTDAKGEYAISGLALGTRNVTVRRLGYAPAILPVDLTTRETHRVDAVLNESVVVMNPMYVIAQRDRALARVGFTDRRKQGLGDFRTRVNFERDNPTFLSDIVGRMRGVRVDYAGGRRVLRAMGSGADCVHLLVDGVRWESEIPGDYDDAVLPQHVAAVEVYSGSAVPAEFEGGLSRGCTTIVVWTRTKVKDFVK